MGPAMARLPSLVVPALCALAAACAAPARADERVVLRFADSASGPERAAARRHAGVEDARALPAIDGVQVVRAADGGAQRAAELLRRSARVLWAQPDERVRIATSLALPSVDSGSEFPSQWELFAGNFPSA